MMPVPVDISSAVPAALRAQLRAATDHRRACEAVVSDLAGVTGLKPSVYLERGGRLRCQAARTYGQVFDGMPPSAGVIGRTYATGQAALITDTATSGDYLEIASEVTGQVCVPLRVGAAVVGVVNAESVATIDDAVAARVQASAEMLAERLAELGGALTETPAQRLVRHAARLSETHEESRLRHEVLRAAVDISGLDTAVIVEEQGRQLGVGEAVGPLAELLRACPREELAKAATLVNAGCSCVTATDDPTAGPPDLLPSALAGGLQSVALLGLTERPPRMLVVGSAQRVPIATETVELLELLCGQAKSAWRSCDLLADLRRQAATDPLTGLAHHGAFYDRLNAATPASVGAVAMVDLDHFKRFNDTRGHPAGDALLRDVSNILRTLVRAEDELFRVGGDEFAVLAVPENRAALWPTAERLEAAVRTATGSTISVGIALTEPGEALPATRKRADAALYAAKQGGRGRIVADAGEPA